MRYSTIVFFGDSFVAGPVPQFISSERPDIAPPPGQPPSIQQWSDAGFVDLVRMELIARLPDQAITVINAGRGGDTSHDLCARLEADVMAHQPDLVCIAVGFNDIWRGFQPGREADAVSLKAYTANYRTLIEQLQSAGIQVWGIEIPYHAAHLIMNQRIALHNQICIALMYEYDTQFVGINEALDSVTRGQRAFDPSFTLRTDDDVHLTALGHYVVGRQLLHDLLP